MWDEVIGHEENKKFLQRLLEGTQHPHALLFYGADGIGKKFLARHFARSLLCLNRQGVEPCGACESCRLLNFTTGNLAHPDFLQVAPDPESKLHMIKTEQLHDLIAQAAYGPTLGKVKLCLIDEAETMNVDAANAFLKLLEEPPAGWVFILVAANKNKLLPTILSRVVQVRFNPLVPAETEQILIRQGQKPEEARVLARLGHGSLGWVQHYTPAMIIAIRPFVLEYLARVPFTAPLSYLQEQAYYETPLELGPFKEGQNLELFCELVQGVLRDVLFLKLALPAQVMNCDVEDKLQELAARWPAEALPGAVRAAGEAASQVASRTNQKTVLELLTFALNDCIEGRA